MLTPVWGERYVDPGAQAGVAVGVDAVAGSGAVRVDARSGPPQNGTDGLTLPLSAELTFTSARSL